MRPDLLRYLLYLPFLILSHGITTTKAVVRNFTIDDTTGDEATLLVPNYRPTPATNPLGDVSPWAGPECGGCAIQPDPKQAHGGTWHAATYHPAIDSISIEFPFYGTAIYVYFIIPHTIQFVTTDIACNFTLDGREPTPFFRNPTDPNAIIYNYRAFVMEGLENMQHSFKIETGNGYNHDAFLAFDYALYTYDDANGPVPSPTFSSASSSASQTAFPTSSSGGAAVPTTSNGGDQKKNVNVAAIAGGVVGGVGIVALGLLVLLLTRRKRAKSQEAGLAPSSQFTSPAMTLAQPLPYAHHKSSGVIHGAGQDEVALYPNRLAPLPPSSTAGTSAAMSMSGSALGSSTFPNEKTALRTQQTTDEIKRARQRELQRQLQAVKAEMRTLQADLQDTDRQASVRSQGRHRDNDQEVVNLREQIRIMSEQMHHLRIQQDSAWAQGLSDEPPPGYTPHGTHLDPPSSEL